MCTVANILRVPAILRLTRSVDLQDPAATSLAQLSQYVPLSILASNEFAGARVVIAHVRRL